MRLGVIEMIRGSCDGDATGGVGCWVIGSDTGNDWE